MSQLETVMDQVKLLPPHDLVKLIRQAAEILEQKQNSIPQPKTNVTSQSEDRGEMECQ